MKKITKIMLMKRCGYSFWDSKIKNLNNYHLTDVNDEIKFKNKNKILTKIPFEKFHLYGFIRNEYSWHSVESFNMNTEYIRKSININFNF